MHQQDRLDVYPSTLRWAESNTTDGGQEAQWTPESGRTPSQLLALVPSAQKSLLYACFQSSMCFPIPCWTTFIWVFQVRPRGKMNIKKCWYQVFHVITQPGYGSERLWQACWINWEVLAWLAPPDLFDLTAPVTPMLPKAAFSFPAAQLPTAMLLCWVKIKGRVQGAQFCSKCLLWASRELPRAISFERTGTDFFFLFLKCKLGKLGRTSVFTGKGTKATTIPTWCKVLPYSMEVTSAPLSSGSEHVWSHKPTFSSIA